MSKPIVSAPFEFARFLYMTEKVANGTDADVLNWFRTFREAIGTGELGLNDFADFLYSRVAQIRQEDQLRKDEYRARKKKSSNLTEDLSVESLDSLESTESVESTGLLLTDCLTDLLTDSLTDSAVKQLAVANTEKKNTGMVVSLQNAVEAIWNAAPAIGRKRSSKKLLDDVWSKLRERPNLADVLNSLEAWKNDQDWKKNGGEFVPGIHRWMKDRKFEHMPEGAKDFMQKSTDAATRVMDELKRQQGNRGQANG